MIIPYDLTTKPWIPCVDQRSEICEVGLRDVITCAHELCAIHNNAPPIEVSLYRLVLAVLHRCFGPEDLNAWENLWRRGRFDESIVNGYLRSWRHRFDLFHPERPFYQTLEWESQTTNSLSFLAIEMASGGNDTLFSSTVDDEPVAMSPAEAARLLVAHQSFSAGGRIKGEIKSRKAAPLRSGAVAMVTGSNLFETLMLNLLVYNPAQGLPLSAKGEDLPTWEQDKPAILQDRDPFGWLDHLTWQSRRLLFDCEKTDDGLVVTGVTIAGGLDPKSGMVRDPHMAWRQNRQKTVMPVPMRVNRVYWRDSFALMSQCEENSDTAHVPPANIVQLAELCKRKIILKETRCQLNLYGIAGKQAKTHAWYHERCPLSMRVLASQDAVGVLSEALDTAEYAFESLRKGIWLVAEEALSCSDKTSQINWSDVATIYWERLSVPFQSLMVGLEENAQDALQNWKSAIQDAALNSYMSGASAYGHSARALRARSLGERTLRFGMNKLTEAAK